MKMHVRDVIHDTMRKNPVLESYLSAEEIDKLVRYWELVQHWGRSLNLSRRKDPAEWACADVADSFLGLHATGLFTEKTENRVEHAMDVGSGAGFPGVALAMLCETVYPADSIEVRWIETLQKRVSFLHRVGRELRLPQVKACHMRIEDVSEPADWVTIRATFPWQELHQARNCVAAGGTLVAFVGREPSAGQWTDEVGRWGWTAHWIPYEVEGLGERAMALASRPLESGSSVAEERGTV